MWSALVTCDDRVSDSGTEAGEAEEQHRGSEHIGSVEAGKMNFGSETGDHDARFKSRKRARIRGQKSGVRGQ
jgi:hypothetical protein